MDKRGQKRVMKKIKERADLEITQKIVRKMLEESKEIST